MDFVFVSFTILYLLFSGSAELDKMLAPLGRITTCGREEDNAKFGSGKHIFSPTSASRNGGMKHETESAGLSSKKQKQHTRESRKRTFPFHQLPTNKQDVTSEQK